MSSECPSMPRNVTRDRSGMIRLASPPAPDGGAVDACASSGAPNGIASAAIKSTSESRLRRVVTNEGIITRSPEELKRRNTGRKEITVSEGWPPSPHTREAAAGGEGSTLRQRK